MEGEILDKGGDGGRIKFVDGEYESIVDFVAGDLKNLGLEDLREGMRVHFDLKADFGDRKAKNVRLLIGDDLEANSADNYPGEDDEDDGGDDGGE